jgi:glycerol kinase
MPELLLALDVGTTTARAMLVTPEGAILGVAARPLRTIIPGPNRAEQDAELVWRASLDCIQEALAKASRAPADLAGIGVTTQRASVVVWEPDSGRPLAPMVLWSDLGSGARSRELAAAGFTSWPQAPACKLQAAIARAGGAPVLWGGLDSYLVYRLSGGGAHVTDLTGAWMTGCLDYARQDGWDAALLAFLGLSEDIFPRLVDSWGPLATASAAVLGAEVPITAMLADQQAGLVAHGALEAGAWKATFGTSGVVMASTGETPLQPHRTMPPEAASRSGGVTRYCVEGMIISTGVAVDWLCSGLGLFDGPAALCAAAGQIDAGGVHMRPSLQGMGAPHGKFGATGLLAGLTPGTRREHLARAVLEGIAFRTREIVETLEAQIPLGEALGVDGGLAASDVFLQILADKLGRPVRRHIAREGTAYGAAMAAALGAGMLSEADLASRARYDRSFEPTIDRDQGAAEFAAWSAAVM